MANTCEQDTFFYCTNFYNPGREDAPDLYSDYVDCVTKKTVSDCGHEFVPELIYGGTDPYHSDSGTPVYVSEEKPTNQILGINEEVWKLGGIISLGILASFLKINY